MIRALPPRLTPKLVTMLDGYTRSRFVADLIAGVTVGLVALPLAMAFGIASGVPPQAGVYTAVIAGFLAAALGGSRFQVSGPTGAFVVIIAGIVAKFGVSGLLLCTAMAGGILVLMGLTGLGAAVRFIPRPVTIGFTNGIAVLIASTQIKDFLGLSIDHSPSEFFDRMRVLSEHLGTWDYRATLVALIAMAVIVFWPRVSRRVPGTIVALALTTVACAVSGWHVETVGSRFGGIPTGLPTFAIPEFRADLIVSLLPSALTVAMLAAIESLLSAVVADNLGGDRHNPDVELVAQGVANLAAPLFGGIPATGAIARTATNIRCGAQTPVAALVHAATLVVILLAAAPLARFIPLPTLAAVLLVVAYNMGEWREIPGILTLSRADRAVWLATFALTVFADLTVAVQVGMVLAALLYIHRVSDTTSVTLVTSDYLRSARPHALEDKAIPPYVSVIKIHGPFLFGATGKLFESAGDLSQFASIVILRLRNMTALDSTGMHAIESFAAGVNKSGRRLIICGARRQPAKILRRARLEHHLDSVRVVPHLEAALLHAAKLHADPGATPNLAVA